MKTYIINKLLPACFAFVGVLTLSNCGSVDHDDHDRDHRRHRGTTTTTTEETTIRSPLSTTVETQTVRSY
ncbi:MAG: hypothetical protein RL693_1186 [Verrucomicrobiota bacterium]